jgi:hypothetical protein
MDVGKKRIYPSAAQKSRLIALVEADEELRRGKFSSSFTKKEGEKRWENIALEVNSIPGSKREWKEWRKVSFLYVYCFLVLKKRNFLLGKKIHCIFRHGKT